MVDRFSLFYGKHLCYATLQTHSMRHHNLPPLTQFCVLKLHPGDIKAVYGRQVSVLVSKYEVHTRHFCIAANIVEPPEYDFATHQEQDQVGAVSGKGR